jgi:hypothetical protein
MEWHERLNHLAFTFGLATRGIALASDRYSNTIDSSLTTDQSATHLAIRKPGDTPVTVYATWQSRKLPELMTPDGPIARELGRQWVVTVDSLWDATYRSRIAAEMGLPNYKQHKVPVMADMRQIRNDIVHHSAIATQRNSGRCKLLGHWISVTEEISITEFMVVEFMELWGLTNRGPIFRGNALGLNSVVEVNHRDQP